MVKKLSISILAAYLFISLNLIIPAHSHYKSDCCDSDLAVRFDDGTGFEKDEQAEICIICHIQNQFNTPLMVSVDSHEMSEVQTVINAEFFALSLLAKHKGLSTRATIRHLTFALRQL